METPTPPKKRLRSASPDITIIVGTPPNQQSFQSYRFILCYASDYFDTMLSHKSLIENKTSTITLPDKDPEEWKVFYQFLDPMTSHTTCITNENAMMLTPWFHEYQMDELFQKCDDIMATIIKYRQDNYHNDDDDENCNIDNNHIPSSSTTQSFLSLYLNDDNSDHHSNSMCTSTSHSHDYDIQSTKFWQTINDKRNIHVVAKLINFIHFCDKYTLLKSLSTSLSLFGLFIKNCIHILHENQNDILTHVIDLYHCYSMDKKLCESLSNCNDVVTFLNDVISKRNDDNDDDDNENQTNNEKKKLEWDNPYFMSMLESKLEVILTNRQMEETKMKLVQTKRRLLFEKDMLRNIKMDMKALPEMFWLRYGHSYDMDGLEHKLQSMVDDLIEEY